MTTVFDSLVNKIHLGVNPYADFPADAPVEQWNGWDSQHPFFHEAIDALRPQAIIEIGSFLGGSAIHMARRLQELKLDAAIICVDTWLAENVLWLDEGWRPRLRHKFGRPEYYPVFLANVIDAGLQDYIVPLPMDSIAAARFLKQLGVHAQLVYVDGSHQKGDVLRDIEFYWGLLDAGGVMLLDDYGNSGTVSFVDHDLIVFCNGRALTFTAQGLKAWLVKPG